VDQLGIVAFPGPFTYVRPGDWVVSWDEKVPAPDTVQFLAGDSLFVLDWQSDGDGTGAWHGWLHGQEIAGDDFWRFRNRRDPRIVLVQELKSTWWVRVRDSAGHEGWIPSDHMAGKSPHYDDGPERCTRRT
jgi:hypothetical protein